MTGLQCHRCGQEYEHHTRGRPPKLCPACRFVDAAETKPDPEWVEPLRQKLKEAS